MEVYDELASCSSDEDDDNDSLYEPSPVRKSTCHGGYLTKVALQKTGHDKENKDPHLAASFSGLLQDGEDGKKVTVEQCKDYLRTHGLRLTGTKAVLIERIKGHIQEQENNDIAQHSESILTGNHGVLRSSNDPIDEGLAKSFANMDLNHVNSTTIIELLKDEKKLIVQDCKAYLRKHGLRLAGTKQVLIERIREHLQIQDDNGMTKYPEDTFNINCQGDACIGDLVLFKQRVYEFFNGPPVGVRTIAGRIIKESYGSAKQQHTFTVEVLWSIGDRPLPPLHPLIIKGRNLYRVKTLRQAWADEEVRKKQLQEKHDRGAAARMERKARIEGRNANWHFKKHEKKIHKANNNDGGNLGYENRKESSNITDPLPKLGRKVDSDGKMGANINAKNGSFGKTSASMHAVNADPPPPCKCVAFVCVANVDPLCKYVASVHAAKVDPSCNYITSVHVAKVEHPCKYSTSIDAKNFDRVSSTSTFIPAKVFDPVCSFEGKFNSSLAGLIIGKNGAYCKEIRRISGAELCVDRDPVNLDLRIVKIRGRVQQRDTALKMVYEKVCCRFFAKNGECSKGEACKFIHALED